MTTSPPIRQLYPAASQTPLDDAHILALYAPDDRAVPLVRANFVSSLDGASTADGLSGALGGAADHRIFDLLRQLSDVIVVGAGTLRAEGYGAMRLSEEASRWRADHGIPPQPHFAIVSARLDLDPESAVFADAPVRPLVLTAASADPDARRRLSRVADVIDCGATRAEGAGLVDALIARGLRQVHCEGGPQLLGTLIADDVLDELCLTTSPLLEGGAAPRIASGVSGVRSMSLDHLLIADGMLFTKYSRTREVSS